MLFTTERGRNSVRELLLGVRNKLLDDYGGPGPLLYNNCEDIHSQHASWRGERSPQYTQRELAVQNIPRLVGPDVVISPTQSVKDYELGQVENGLFWTARALIGYAKSGPPPATGDERASILEIRAAYLEVLSGGSLAFAKQLADEHLETFNNPRVQLRGGRIEGYLSDESSDLQREYLSNWERSPRAVAERIVELGAKLAPNFDNMPQSVTKSFSSLPESGDKGKFIHSSMGYKLREIENGMLWLEYLWDGNATEIGKPPITDEVKVDIQLAATLYLEELRELSDKN